MSGEGAFEAKEQVRQATDIVDLVGGYLQLRRQGRRYVGLCPWHDDTRPSLTVDPERQSWRCWVCNIGGDVFSFVMQREGVGFGEALAMLAERAGVPLKRSGRAAASGKPNDKQSLLRAMAWAEQQYHECLLRSPQAEAARQYIRRRGLSDESISRFHLGYAPGGWRWLLDRARSAGFSADALTAAGLAARSDKGNPYDRFRNRLIFSIRDVQGRPVALGGRVLPGEQAEAGGAKYINSPETRLFVKSELLYGLDAARDAIVRSRTAVVMEGYTDVIMAHQHGLGNAVAVLGTALGPRHLHLLRRYADRVILVLDGDEAGRRRAAEVLELFVAQQMDVRIATLPAGMDPCELLAARGPAALQALIDAAPDALEHRLATLLEGVDPARDTHAANRAVEGVLAVLAAAPADTPAARLRGQQLLGRLARTFHVDEEALRQRLSELRRRRRPQPASGPRSEAARPRAAQLDPRDAELLEILILHPSLAPAALDQLRADQLQPGWARDIYRCYQTLRRAGRPLDFQSVLTEVEDVELKSLLVELEERAGAKAQQALEDAETRLQDLVRQYQYAAQQAVWSAQLAALESGQLNDEEELTELQRLLEWERNRRGISSPTDG